MAMKTYNLLVSTGTIEDLKGWPRGVFQLRAESIENLRKNLIHKKYRKNDVIYFDIYSASKRPLGVLSISTFEDKIFLNPMSLKAKKGDLARVHWRSPDGNAYYPVNPKTGELGGNLYASRRA